MNAKEKLQYYAQKVAKQMGNSYEIALILKMDYSNVKKFMKDYRKMPIAKAFEIIDYMNAKIVVFRSK